LRVSTPATRVVPCGLLVGKILSVGQKVLMPMQSLSKSEVRAERRDGEVYWGRSDF